MSEKNIHQRLLSVMRQVSYVRKDQRKVAGQYTAVKHDDVVAKVRPALVDAGVLVSTTVDSCVVSRETVGTRAVNIATVSVIVKFINADKPDDLISGTFWGQGDDAGDKAVGKAVSYACKYALLKTLLLETGDDPDHDASIERTVAQAPVQDPADPNSQVWRDKALGAYKEVSAKLSKEEADRRIAGRTSHKERYEGLMGADNGNQN
jgi:hypothetical protein